MGKILGLIVGGIVFLFLCCIICTLVTYEGLYKKFHIISEKASYYLGACGGIIVFFVTVIRYCVAKA